MRIEPRQMRMKHIIRSCHGTILHKRQYVFK